MITDTIYSRYFFLPPGGISNHMPNTVWDEITYRSLNFNDFTIEVCELLHNFIPHFIIDVITYPH